MLVAGCSPHAPRAPSTLNLGDSTAAPNPSLIEGLILQVSEGERRIRRLPPTVLSNLTAPFILKVDRRNGGSADFVMIYEDIPRGQGIAPHHHAHADEILFVHRGTGVASLGTRSTAVTSGPPSTSRRARARACGTRARSR
jgi:hypothetical protein